MEQLTKRLEETWGKTYSNMQTTNIVSPKITLPGKATWEPDPKPLMVNHPPRVTDSNTRITLSEDSLKGPCPQDDSGLDWRMYPPDDQTYMENGQGTRSPSGGGPNLFPIDI